MPAAASQTAQLPPAAVALRFTRVGLVRLGRGPVPGDVEVAHEQHKQAAAEPGERNFLRLWQCPGVSAARKAEAP